MNILQIAFEEIFGVGASIPDLMIRGALLYFGLLLLLRILPRRTGGELATMDLLFVLLVAEAATHSLGSYSSVTEAFIVIGTLMLLNYLVNILSHKFPFFERLISASHLQIIKNGSLILRNMRREYLTKEELMENLRHQGIEDLQDVKAAYIEGDGKITVIKQNAGKSIPDSEQYY